MFFPQTALFCVPNISSENIEVNAIFFINFWILFYDICHYSFEEKMVFYQQSDGMCFCWLRANQELKQFLLVS